jgi:hypothetical protein
MHPRNHPKEPPAMIHYSCDQCKRPLDKDELRYVVRMEVYAALDVEAYQSGDEDPDHLQELQQILQRADDDSAEVAPDVYQELRFDLCDECRKRFVKHPLGRDAAEMLSFSQN